MSHKKVPESIRKAVEERASNCCEYCLTPDILSGHRFSMDCIQPWSKEGAVEIANLALSCIPCNNSKYNKTEGFDPVTEQIVRLFNPRMDDWKDHFLWNKTCLNIIGKTAIGRATVSTLKMNTSRLIAVRKILIRLKIHPALS